MTPENPTPDPVEKRPYRKTPPATPAVQAWLDGEAEKDGLTDPDERETAELWTRINTETERLRRRSTPIHVQQKILSSLPDEPPGSASSTAGGLITLRVSTAVLVGAALVAVGLVIGAFFLAR